MKQEETQENNRKTDKVESSYFTISAGERERESWVQSNVRARRHIINILHGIIFIHERKRRIEKYKNKVKN